MSGRIQGHLRSNGVGYLALFFAMSGTAVALDGANTVFSDDISAGEVRTSDLGANSVNSAKVTNDSLAGDEIADGGLLPEDVNQFWAVVDANGTLARASEAGVTVTHTAGTGTYVVDFNRTISDCAFSSTIGLSAPSAGTSARGFTTVVSPTSSPNDSVLVTTDDISTPLDSAERGFHLQVSC
jgi:hypothetical protein